MKFVYTIPYNINYIVTYPQFFRCQIINNKQQTLWHGIPTTPSIWTAKVLHPQHLEGSPGPPEVIEAYDLLLGPGVSPAGAGAPWEP